MQNSAHFQQFSRPDAKGNTFAPGMEVPRCEAACVVCQQKDFVEHRHKLSLFADPPAHGARGAPQPAMAYKASASDALSEEEAPMISRPLVHIGAAQPALAQHGEVYYLQSPEHVHALLDVERYAQRWPLIPVEELHASSNQHPTHPQWRWPLHVCRVPVVRGSTQTAASPPRCAGIGEVDAVVFCCWDCLADIADKKPKMPVNACANDSWIGRERTHVREASAATNMLASLGRACWKQLRLGRRGDPAVQEKALTTNTIFFAQPTTDVPELELPPGPDALVGTFNFLFTRTLHDLSKAE